MTQENKLEASLSALVMSIGSSALMAMGLSPNPITQASEENPEMAKFNIDLLMILKEKTKGNLNQEEETFLNSLIKDLQMKFVNK